MNIVLALIKMAHCRRLGTRACLQLVPSAYVPRLVRGTQEIVRLHTYCVCANLLINRSKLIIYRLSHQIENEFAIMARLMLSDERWSKLKEIMLQHQIYNKPNLRMMVEAMLYRMRVGCPWRDLPVEFGFWHSIYQQFNRWSSKNK